MSLQLAPSLGFGNSSAKTIMFPLLLGATSNCGPLSGELKCVASSVLISSNHAGPSNELG
jgi:hypothetical protein